MHALSAVKGGDFEVVDTSKIGVVFVGRRSNDVIDGNDGVNRMFGDRGDDRMSGAGGRDRIIGWTGDDVLTGGKGSDHFVFDDHWAKGYDSKRLGDDEITDFVARGRQHDMIEIAKSLGVSSFVALMDHAHQQGHDLVITLNRETEVTLDDVGKADLTAGDFSFV